MSTSECFAAFILTCHTHKHNRKSNKHTQKHSHFTTAGNRMHNPGTHAYHSYQKSWRQATSMLLEAVLSWRCVWGGQRIECGNSEFNVSATLKRHETKITTRCGDCAIGNQTISYCCNMHLDGVEAGGRLETPCISLTMAVCACSLWGGRNKSRWEK